ncbi:coiled-coil domain-containing protein 107 [Pyxicephalus adspersus]|uniref:Resistance to inhibitors of cholinesterase protein 3 N-terminal domain-containing protein n=1 Tax=Pyxicephalus adspersus TaxID=30357 RepID=A0AAV3B2N8_PYXAD|nr:TPA: hypothetical protein GDO54_007039 [Pyxicephalus adspersus]
MVLSASQNILLSVSLALCLCFLVPRMIGGGGEVGKTDPKRMTAPFRGHKESPSQSQRHRVAPEKGFANMDHVRSAMEQELKSETPAGGLSITFALMPVYAVGVALFAAYKFTKIRSNEKNTKSKLQEEDVRKAKKTESQLLELERHLIKTEEMLNSLLKQLDPLSNCVNTLATQQKNEIMNQLLSIRHLMKKSGMEKSASHSPANQTCENTLEALIHSFETQQVEVHENEVERKSEEFPPDMEDTDMTAQNPIMDKSSLIASEDLCERDLCESDGANVTSSPVSEGLRRRMV